MAVDFKIVEEAKKPVSMNPKKFALWLFIVTVLMIFAALTSAYLVRRANGSWMIFDLPTMFWVNTGVILARTSSSIWPIVSVAPRSVVAAITA